MDHHELGVALAVAQIVEFRRQADRWRMASRVPGRTGTRRRDRAPASPRPSGRRDPAAGCAGGTATAVAASAPERAAEEAAMLAEHHHEVGVFDAGHCRARARQARRRASVALWSSGAAIVLAAVALLTG